MAFKNLSLDESIAWIEFHSSVFKNAPTIFGQSDERIIRAGQLCYNMLINIPADKKRAITDSDVAKSLGADEFKEDIVI